MNIHLGKRLIRAALGAAVIAGSLASVGIARADGVHLLWVQPMKDHPVHRLMQAGFLNKCKELGYTCEVVGDPSATNWDIPATLPLAEAALARTKYDAIGVYGPDPAIFSYIAKLGKEGFPVVTWHVLPAEGSVQGLKAATGEDIANAGTNAAVAIGEKLGGKGTVALTQGASNDTENAMSDAFRKTIAAKYPNIKVLDTQMEGFEPSAAEAKAVAILQANPDVTAAFGTTGNSIQTWSGAARKAGRDVVIIGMDYIRQNLDLVKSGAAYGIVAQPLYEESAKVAELLGALAQGKSVPYLNPLPAGVITAGDLAPYYKMLDSAGQ
ncbi:MULTISPECIES: substrate-binding domain-containing protein [unclassified Mesorhizobium]|uniref:sugar ABC transporter substrate-binding protein n=1 Tax=unclassified Mesorhizobium TaxID=325217 RepID=UPI00086F8B4D|nr:MULTISPECIES: substrate-binding domain-containing protein [unclassified Mesorhizobium]MBN9259070.1 substrate-binding domain-containing protein [Mesorhizobium sp.]ODT14302.1 MAG: sugar ABC transporter substrate-binding protein [Mesorhizobium sp. SCN 65-12]OJX83583.1 MAG: sugar ABC transporter substrate-binding protein [Mesorhizobium sp. 65-26]